jgi:hypothetical protein
MNEIVETFLADCDALFGYHPLVLPIILVTIFFCAALSW